MDITTIPSTDDYRSASKSEKAAMRALWTRNMNASLAAMDPSAFAIRAAMVAWTDATDDRPTFDYSNACSVRIVSLRAAADAIESAIGSGTYAATIGAPDGTELTFDSTVDVDPAIVDRFVTESYKRSEKRPLTSYLVDAFASDAIVSGRDYTMTEIAQMIEKSVPSYGRVSRGAVRNAIESGRVDGATFVPATDTTVTMARKS